MARPLFPMRCTKNSTNKMEKRTYSLILLVLIIVFVAACEAVSMPALVQLTSDEIERLKEPCRLHPVIGHT